MPPLPIDVHEPSDDLDAVIVESPSPIYDSPQSSRFQEDRHGITRAFIDQEILQTTPGSSRRHSPIIGIHTRPPSPQNKPPTPELILGGGNIVQSPSRIRSSGSPSSALRASPTHLEPQEHVYSTVYTPSVRRRSPASVLRQSSPSEARDAPQETYHSRRPLLQYSNVHLRRSFASARRHSPSPSPSRPVTPVIPVLRATSPVETRLGSQYDESVEDLNADPGAVPPTAAAAAWMECEKSLRKHDWNTIKAWKEDIDTLLVLAGLISAVLTAFNIEAYKLLQPDPQDTTNMLLQQMLQKSDRSEVQAPPTFSKSAFAIRLNTLWFSSLVFSLSAASIGILVKQWLQSYITSAASSPREKARIRQFRYQGLIRWRIPEVIALLPILVQIALAFFFVGLLDLLWKLDSIVAGIVSTIVAASLLFVFITTFTPSFSRDCPHKSPQSLAVYRGLQSILRGLMWLTLRSTRMLGEEPPVMYVYPDMFRPSARRRRASFLDHVLGRHHHTWREREKDLMREREAHFDHQVLANADATLMDDEFLSRVVRACLNDVEHPTDLSCLIDILHNRAHWHVTEPNTLKLKPRWKPYKAVDIGICALVHLVVDVLPRMAQNSQSDIENVLACLEQLCHAFPFDPTHSDAVKVYQRIFLNLSPYLLRAEECVHDLAFSILRFVISRGMTAPVASSAIENIVAFSNKRREANKTRTYYHACGLALELFRLTEHIPSSELPRITTLLQEMLRLFEDHLVEAETKEGHEYFAPSPSVLVAVVYVAQNPRGLDIRPGLLTVLERLVRGARGVHSHVGSAPGSPQEDRLYASELAFEQLRRLYDARRPMVQKQRMQMPVDNLEDMGLRLPEG